MVKLCFCCQKEFPIKLFQTQPGKKTYKNCRPCRSSSESARKIKLKEQCVSYKGGQCSVCGYKKCLSALEFHHVDPKEKKYSISKARGRKFENLKDELDKCVLLCRNCHAETHYLLFEQNLNAAPLEKVG